MAGSLLVAACVACAHGHTTPRPGCRLDVVLGGSLRVRDQFWWDLHSPSPSPEEFAQEMCADSGIDPCHGAALAAAIRIEVCANLPRLSGSCRCLGGEVAVRPLPAFGAATPGGG